MNKALDRAASVAVGLAAVGLGIVGYSAIQWVVDTVGEGTIWTALAVVAFTGIAVYGVYMIGSMARDIW